MVQVESKAVESQATGSTMANPAALGLSSANAELFFAPQIVVGLALFYGCLIQVLAGLLANLLVSRNSAFKLPLGRIG